MQRLIIVLILIWLGWHVAIPIDLTVSDLGRHIKNGELIAHGNGDVLYKNFYSYTNPQYPFINHHWLFGVFCYVIWHFVGITGLYFIYVMLELLTFYVFFDLARRSSSFITACAFGLLAFPLISFRYEIRPEGISCLFAGLFWWMILAFQEKRIKPVQLTISLCALQVLWVNIHIFFILGPLLIFLFWCQERSNGRKEEAAVLQKIFFCLLAACLINPSGINGALVPFQLGKAYSYLIMENASVFYLLSTKMFFLRPLLLYFLVALGILVLGLLFLVQKEGFKKYIFITSLALILSLTAMKASRMIGILGFFWIPMMAFIYTKWIESKTVHVQKIIEVLVVITAIIVSAYVNCDWKQRHSLGVVAGCNDAAYFFKHERISGVIFNNYDIGGYLIFHLSPQHQMFVDDRMEAYPEDFLKKTYIPMQMDNDLWQKMEIKYHFNVIFYTLDATPWGYAFLKERFKDHSWAVVYLRNNAVIFLKRNAQNASIIKGHELHVQVS